MTKICTRCKQEKEFSEFFKRPESRLGVKSHCIECHREKDKARWRANEDYRRKSMLAARGYRERNREKEKLRAKNRPRDYKAHRASMNPVKEKARRQLRYAITRGRIVKPKQCEGCQQELVLHGHHRDYSKPLEVIWLCSVCHGKEHRIS